jgi:hypothetical protein
MYRALAAWKKAMGEVETQIMIAGNLGYVSKPK